MEVPIMLGYHSDIEQDSIDNINFRNVVYTGANLQLVLMTLNPKEDIGLEVHPENDQFFRIEQGQGVCLIDGHEYELSDGSAIVVPAGAEHNIVNTSESEDLKLYTIYAPPHHKADITRATKEEAEQNEADFDGQTTEQYNTH